MSDAPRRIQLSRAKGWRMPRPCVVVARPSIFGNPFDWQEARDEWGGDARAARESVVNIYRDWLTMTEQECFAVALRARRVAILARLPELRGKSLACWCKLPIPGEPDHCHAAVLLEIANADEQGELDGGGGS